MITMYSLVLTYFLINFLPMYFYPVQPDTDQMTGGYKVLPSSSSCRRKFHINQNINQKCLIIVNKHWTEYIVTRAMWKPFHVPSAGIQANCGFPANNMVIIRAGNSYFGTKISIMRVQYYLRGNM